MDPTPAPVAASPAPPAPAADATDPKVAERMKKLETLKLKNEELEKKRAEQGNLSAADRARVSKNNAKIQALESGEEEPRTVHPGPESNEELAQMMGRFFGRVVFPILGVFARRWFEGTIDKLTPAEQLELGNDWVPWARKLPWLVFVARWATAPIALLEMVERKFRPFRTPDGISPSAPGTDRTLPQPPLRAVPGDSK